MPWETQVRPQGEKISKKGVQGWSRLPREVGDSPSLVFSKIQLHKTKSNVGDSSALSGRLG